MEKIKDLVREYLTTTIQTKRNMRKRIYKLEDENKELKENTKFLIDQIDKYKKSNQKLRRKLKEIK